VRKPVYLDHHATTPMDPRVLAVWDQTAREHFGNPASSGHAFGWAAARCVELAREHVAALLGATPHEIIFTSGATEANNLALLGAARAAVGRERDRLVTSNLEHPSVQEPLEHLARHEAWQLTTMAADREGLVEAADLQATVDRKTLLVSLIAAQNEIGTLQPLAAAADACRGAGALLHVDASQAAGRIELDVERDRLDLVSLSGHKLYGPKGIGALFVRRREPRVVLKPLQFGGGQERGLRPGTLNVPAIAAFGEACRLARTEGQAEALRVAALRDLMWQDLQDALPDVHLNGHPTRRLPGNLNVSFGGVPAGRLVGALTGLAVSTGAACSSGDGRPSSVLRAIGVSPALAGASLRLGLGRDNTAAEISFATETIIAAVKRLRADQSPS
jgi:cysteine desulfurase